MTARYCALSILLISMFSFSSCSDNAENQTRAEKVENRVMDSPFGPAPETKDADSPGSVWFSDITRAAGITFRGRSGTAQKMMIPENIGQGAMFFDFDNDGDQDIYFCNGGDLRAPGDKRFPNALFRNDGGLKFTLVSASGLECLDWSCGAYTVDFDEDGWDDVYVTQLGSNRFFRNLGGSGKFKDVTAEVGGADKGWSTSAAFFDADGDGDLDLYVCNYLEFDPQNPPNDGVPCEWRNLKVCCGPRGLEPSPDSFYENQDGKFVEATETFGFAIKDKRGRIKGGYSLGVVTADFDDDGDTDVYVAVDSRPNLFFENAGGGKFHERAHEWQIAVNADAVEQAGMGVTAADLNDDGRMDLFVTNFSHDTNTMYINSGEPGNMYFDDRTSLIGLGGSASYPFLSWGTGAYDFDLNGYQDIFVASGHVYPQAEGIANLGTSYPQPNQLFMREVGGTLKYRDRAPEAGAAMKMARVSRGAIFSDLDRDGRVDILITNVDSWPTLLHNQSTAQGPWLGLELDNNNPANRHANGATVIAVTESGRRIRRDVLGGSGYLGSSDPALHFGFGSDAPKSFEIRWPNGSKITLPAPNPNAWYRLKRGETQFTELR
ncbi:MAG: CRTAC1 family protein [Planctomycetota bacterium]